jgi:acetyl esterase/lipase
MKIMQSLPAGLALAAVLWSCSKSDDPAQPAAVRYRDRVFTAVEETTVVYSSVYNLSADVFTPAGDDATNRPVVILAHGGGFFSGSRTSFETRYWALELAKRGYVTVSISYRLALTALDMLDSAKAISQVIKGVNDGRAAVRFFRQSASHGNPFGINPDQIIVGGTSAGAVLFVQQAYLRDTVEAEPHIRYFLDINGGLDGNSGNAGVSDAVLGVVNLAGGIYNPAYISPGEAPIWSVHGDADQTVPYGCDDVFQSFSGGANLINLCGSSEVHAAALAAGVPSALWTLAGQDHVPWAGTTEMVQPLSADMESEMAAFLYDLVK